MPTSIIFKAAKLFFYKITTHFQYTSASAALVFEIRPLRVLSLKSACPNSQTLNRLTQRLTVLMSTH